MSHIFEFSLRFYLKMKHHMLLKRLSGFWQVQPGSPAEAAGLQPFFDFILSLDNKRLVRLFILLS